MLFSVLGAQDDQLAIFLVDSSAPLDRLVKLAGSRLVSRGIYFRLLQLLLLLVDDGDFVVFVFVVGAVGEWD